jgi:uncharacterized protein (TIGR03437 family)
LAPASPALFQADPQTVIATRPDGSLITEQNPAQAADIVILYATGLGPVVPPLGDREIPANADSLQTLAGFQVTLGGAPVSSDHVLYAGVSPGFGGLYQVNLKLPDAISTDPTIQVSVSGQTSPASIVLPVKPQ